MCTIIDAEFECKLIFYNKVIIIPIIILAQCTLYFSCCHLTTTVATSDFCSPDPMHQLKHHHIPIQIHNFCHSCWELFSFTMLNLALVALCWPTSEYILNCVLSRDFFVWVDVCMFVSKSFDKANLWLCWLLNVDV